MEGVQSRNSQILWRMCGRGWQTSQSRKDLDVHLPIWELHRLVVCEGVLGDPARLQSQQRPSEVALRHLQCTPQRISALSASLKGVSYFASQGKLALDRLLRVELPAQHVDRGRLAAANSPYPQHAARLAEYLLHWGLAPSHISICCEGDRSPAHFQLQGIH